MILHESLVLEALLVELGNTVSGRKYYVSGATILELDVSCWIFRCVWEKVCTVVQCKRRAHRKWTAAGQVRVVSVIVHRMCRWGSSKVRSYTSIRRAWAYMAKCRGLDLQSWHLPTTNRPGYVNPIYYTRGHYAIRWKRNRNDVIAA